jgi:hypothetical protein
LLELSLQSTSGRGIRSSGECGWAAAGFAVVLREGFKRRSVQNHRFVELADHGLEVGHVQELAGLAKHMYLNLGKRGLAIKMANDTLETFKRDKNRLDNAGDILQGHERLPLMLDTPSRQGAQSRTFE